MRRKAAHAEEHVNHEAWVIPYADLLTLLLAMFLALWATGRADAEKLRALASAFREVGAPVGRVVDPEINSGTPDQDILTIGGLGVLEGGWTSSVTEMVSRAQYEKGQEALEQLAASEAAQVAEAEGLAAAADDLKAQVAQIGLGDKVEFSLTDRGLQVVLPIDQVLFATGSADLTPDGTALLATFAPVLADLGNPIEVVGHTDSQPIAAGGRYESNLELSAARASRVGDYLIQQLGFPADEVRASGVGDTRPIASNATEEGRAANRRVELTVLFTTSTGSGPTTTGTSPTTEGTTSDG